MKGALVASVCVAALQLAVSSPAMAQAAGAPRAPAASETQVGEVVVTAQRREERLQDVPLAVSALTSADLARQGIANVGDLGAGRVPGLSVSSLFGSEMTIAVNVRGFGPTDASQGTGELPVTVYVDGVPIARAQGLAMDLITPERIEVLRGPQGQLFGRNSVAGAIQVVTRRPSGEFGGSIRSGVGNFGLFSTQARLDLPEFAGFKVQLSGNFRRHSGYYKNPRNSNLEGVSVWANNPQASYHFPVSNYDRKLSSLKTYGGRAAVEYDKGPFNAYYAYDYSWGRDDQGITFFSNSPTSGTIFNPAGGTGPVGLVVAAGPGGQLLSFPQFPLGSHVPKSAPYSLPWVPLYTKVHGHILNLTYDATENLTLRSITGSRYVRRQGGNVLTSAVNAVLPTAYEYMRSKSFSQELQAIYTSHRINVTAGGIYFRERIKDERESGFAVNCLPAAGFPCTQNGQPSRAIFNLGAGSAGFKRSFSRTEVYGLYAQATYTPPIVDDRLELTAGVRYSKDKKDGFRPIDFGLNPVTGVISLRNHFETERVDPAFTVKYKVNDDINVYTRYAVGYRDGGSSVRSPTFQPFDEDVMKSWEVGIKSDLLDRRLRLNAAAFSNRIKGAQIALQSNPSGSPSQTDTFNSAQARKIRGFEVEAIAKPTPQLTISGSYTYMHMNRPLIGLDRVAAGTPPNSFRVHGTFSDVTGLIPDAATVAAHPNSIMILLGQMAPKHSGSVAIDYTVPLEFGTLAFHGDWVRSTKFFSGAPQNYQTKVVNGVATPQIRFSDGVSTDRFNASVSLRDLAVIGKSMEVRFWIKNIFNHADNAFSFPGATVGPLTPQPASAIYVQPPRTFGAELTVDF